MMLIASLVAMIARRIALPYTVGLVAAGALVALFRAPLGIHLTRDLVFSLLLPPLIFEAALQIEWSHLKRDLTLVIVLATFGIVASAAVIGFGLVTFAHWPAAPALVIAVLLSATDPVAVIATFNEAKVGGRVRLLVEAESLFNDGTAAVMFTIAVAAATGGTAPELLPGLWSFVATFAGGIVCGLAVGGLALLLAWKTDDHLVEIAFTSVAAYGSFQLAEHFHLSGILAAMSAGILMGNVGSCGSLTDKGRDAVISFWEYIAFVANSIIFLLIGSELVAVSFGSFWPTALLVIALSLAGRFLSVYGICALFSRSASKVSRMHQFILFWGGLRGALALALALALPETFPLRGTITGIVFAVVGFSVVVQGLTIAPVLRRLPTEGSE
jgi:CPA1 family monovalent cation:H+ antiporter